MITEEQIAELERYLNCVKGIECAATPMWQTALALCTEWREARKPKIIKSRGKWRCAQCGRSKSLHQSETLNCPVGWSIPVTEFRETTFTQ